MSTLLCLKPSNLCWIDDTQDNPHDLCAHGSIEFSVDGHTLLSHDDRSFTVSAAAIYLLRTLEKDHTIESPVCEFLFPCCGSPEGVEPNGDVLLLSCCGGEKFQVHSKDRNVYLRDQTDKEFCVSDTQWRNSVLLFSKTIWEFYNRSSPKKADDRYTDMMPNHLTLFVMNGSDAIPILIHLSTNYPYGGRGNAGCRFARIRVSISLGLLNVKSGAAKGLKPNTFLRIGLSIFILTINQLIG